MSNVAKTLVEKLRTKYCCSDWDKGCNCETSADLIETQAREAAAKDAEIARLRKELSDMATKYSCAVDTFNTGFSGYEAVLLHQRRIAHEGPPSNWKDGMKAYAARAALAGDSHD